MSLGRAVNWRGRLAGLAALLLAVQLSAQTPAELLKQAIHLGDPGDQPARRAEIQKLLEIRPVIHAQADRQLEFELLHELGLDYYIVHSLDDALQAQQEALGLAIALQDTGREIIALNEIGSIRFDQKKFIEAIDAYTQALALPSPGTSTRAGLLFMRGSAFLRIPDIGRARADLEAAVRLYHLAKDGPGEAAALYALGAAHDAQSDMLAAIDCFERASRKYLAANLQPEAAVALSNLGSDYRNLSRYEEAVRAFEQAHVLIHDKGQPVAEAKIVNNLGVVYSSLGQYDKMVEYVTEALALSKDEPLDVQAMGYGNLATAYQNLKNYDKALELHHKALALARQAKNKRVEAICLNNLGKLYLDRKDYLQAAPTFRSALALMHASGEIRGGGIVLSNLSEVYLRLGDQEGAIECADTARGILHGLKDRNAEAVALNKLMKAWAARGSPELAAYYGKQAVNLFQEIRGGLQSLTPDLQHSYLNGVEPIYRKLADLLIAQGRLTEAEQTLALLKDQEFFAFVRSDAAASGPSGRLPLTPAEAEWAKSVDTQRVEIGRKRGELLAKPDRTDADDRQIAEYDRELLPGAGEFQRFLDKLVSQTAGNSAASERARELKDAEGLMRVLGKLPAGTVAIYTLAAEDKYRAILVTPQVEQAYEYPIPAADLNAKVFALRQGIETRQGDVKTLSKQLFDIMIGPKLDEDLKQAKAQTIMWSLDGTLRYLPLAALFDGQKYLIERFRLEVFTTVSLDRLRDQPSRTWNAAALGVTKAHGDFRELPSVAGEVKGLASIMPGEVRLDEQFTQNEMQRALRNRYRVVHIASHFRFEPGNETDSFLLLGDGTHLSIADLKALPPSDDLDLLTLSACNTGIGSAGAQGTEVESFGMLAQKKGASAVLASLWEVSDSSTSLLMQEFYSLREKHPGMTKAEALREAQLALLQGRLKPGSQDPARGIQPKNAGHVEDRSYAQPYYWAPFFLIGNWL